MGRRPVSTLSNPFPSEARVLTPDPGVEALLDFLMGFTIDDVRRRLALPSVHDAERLIRIALLRHGYSTRGSDA